MMIHTARVFDNRDTKEVRLPLPPFCRSDECIYLYIYIYIGYADRLHFPYSLNRCIVVYVPLE